MLEEFENHPNLILPLSCSLHFRSFLTHILKSSSILMNPHKLFLFHEGFHHIATWNQLSFLRIPCSYYILTFALNVQEKVFTLLIYLWPRVPLHISCAQYRLKWWIFGIHEFKMCCFIYLWIIPQRLWLIIMCYLDRIQKIICERFT